MRLTHIQIKNAKATNQTLKLSDGNSVIATSGKNVDFLEDPEQPFFQYFNILNIDIIGHNEILRIVTEDIADTFFYKNYSTLLTFPSENWISDITDGKICNIIALVDAFKEVKENQNIEILLKQILRSYYLKLYPVFDKIVYRLSYNEKRLLDKAHYVGETFYPKNIKINNINISQTIQGLVDKNIFTQHEGIYDNGSYKFESNVFKSFLRFFKNCEIIEVLKPREEISYKDL